MRCRGRSFLNFLSSLKLLIQGKSHIASIYARKCEIGEEGDNTTEFNLPDLYEKHLVVDEIPIELNVFDLPGARAPRAVKSRTNIYPQSVSYTFESSLAHQ